MTERAGADHRGVVAYAPHPASIDRPASDPADGVFAAATWFAFSSPEPPPPPAPQPTAVAAERDDARLARAVGRHPDPPRVEEVRARPAWVQAVRLARPRPASPPYLVDAIDDLAVAEPDVAAAPAPVHPDLLSGWTAAEPDRLAETGPQSQPMDTWADNPAPSEAHTSRRRIGGLVLLVALAALVIGLGVGFLPGLLGGGGAMTGLFNAPMLVIRASQPGRVSVVFVQPGQSVQPSTVLLTLHTDNPAIDRQITSGVRGVIRSVETVPGSDIAAGAPLVRIHDCDRAFLTVPPGSHLTDGEAVRVQVASLPPFDGRVRPAAGIMEPPDTLVVGMEPGRVPAACPVGAQAEITPLALASAR
jgi:hypothetical protein